MIQHSLNRNFLSNYLQRIQFLEQSRSQICTATRHQHSIAKALPESSTSPLDDISQDRQPRWSYTPERLKMPVRVRPVDSNKKWECNNDPKRLDRFYINFLGLGGDKLLSDEVKWLAITHKSFEQGSRGFNDRLAFLGRRILNLQTNLMLLASTVATPPEEVISPNPDTRTPNEHPALEGLKNLFYPPLSNILSREKLASHATTIGMRPIIRWHPRMTHDLDASGIETVLATSLYAIVGAIALERGGEASSEIARNNILRPMGVR